MEPRSPKPARCSALRRVAVVIAACSVPALGGQGACGQCQYDVTMLEYPITCPFLTVRTAGISWNDHGAIVGYYQCPIWKHTEAFLWTPEEGFLTLPRPAGVTSQGAADINNAGVIVGNYLVSGVGYRGYVYEEGVYTEVEPLPGGAWSAASAINDAGQVTGYRSIGGGAIYPYSAYVWRRDEGVIIDLGVMSGPASSGSAINEAGIVTGWTGTGAGTISDTFVWNAGDLSFLGPVPGGFTSRPWGLGEAGEIVGMGRIELEGFPTGANRAFLWESGQFIMLGSLEDHMLSSARDVSSATGQVVGISGYVDGNPNIAHGFIWQHGAIAQLDTLLSPDLSIEIESAVKVADDGTILAFGESAALIVRPLDVPLGDLDFDCRVGIVDLLKLLAAWGPCAPQDDCGADLNDDSVVDGVDFAMLLMNWG